MSKELLKREARYYPGLQVAEDMSFKEKDWKVQRAGWLVMAMLIVSALIGVFSKGPLSHATASDPAGIINIEYERFQRFQSSSAMNIEIREGVESQGLAQLFISEEMANNFEIENMRPSPQNTTLTEDGWIFDFPVTGTPASIFLSVKPEKLAKVSGRIGLNGQDPAELNIFVYP